MEMQWVFEAFRKPEPEREKQPGGRLKKHRLRFA